MLPLRTLLVSYDALSLSDRAGAILLAREAGGLAARLIGPGGDRGAGARVWQRLVIEEALLRGIVDIEEAMPLMHRALTGEESDPRLEAFLDAWIGAAPRETAGAAERPLTVMRGGRASPRAAPGASIAPRRRFR